MTTTNMTQNRSDAAIRDDVEQEIAWTPDVDSASVGVAVEDGVVTLTGQVRSHAERLQASKAALRVAGVRALAEELSVRTPTSPRSDADVAAAVRTALEQDSTVPSDTIDVQVSEHIVTLTGTAHWYFQRLAAVRDAERVAGVHYVLSRIELTPRPTAPDTEVRIRQAFVRNAQIDADHIDVAVQDTTVTLTGHVRTWAERRQAEIAAWRSPHVTDVRNELRVEP